MGYCGSSFGDRPGHRSIEGVNAAILSERLREEELGGNGDGFGSEGTAAEFDINEDRSEDYLDGMRRSWNGQGTVLEPHAHPSPTHPSSNVSTSMDRDAEAIPPSIYVRQRPRPPKSEAILAGAVGGRRLSCPAGGGQSSPSSKPGFARPPLPRTPSGGNTQRPPFAGVPVVHKVSRSSGIGGGDCSSSYKESSDPVPGAAHVASDCGASEAPRIATRRSRQVPLLDGSDNESEDGGSFCRTYSGGLEVEQSLLSVDSWDGLSVEGSEASLSMFAPNGIKPPTAGESEGGGKETKCLLKVYSTSSYALHLYFREHKADRLKIVIWTRCIVKIDVKFLTLSSYIICCCTHTHAVPHSRVGLGTSVGYLGTSRKRVSFAEYAEELQFSDSSGSPVSITEEELLEAQGLAGMAGGTWAAAEEEAGAAAEAAVEVVNGGGSGPRRGLTSRWVCEW